MLRKGSLRGDVTGDGKPDRVAVVEDPRVAFRCRFAVAVYTRGRVLLRPLGRFTDPGAVIGQPWPLVRLLARIDRRRGAEILLAVSSGAAFEQAQLLTVRGGRIARFQGPPGFAGGLFSYGSMVPAGDSFDCPRTGAGVVLEARFGELDPNGRRYRYSLIHYRVEGLGLRWTRTRTTVLRSGVADRAPRWWRRYFAELAPFRHCTVALSRLPWQ